MTYFEKKKHFWSIKNTKEDLDVFWLNFKDFEWKNILDIGWWLSPFLLEIQKNTENAKLTIVDPVFSHANLDDLVSENISMLCHILKEKKDIIKNNNNKIEKFEKEEKELVENDLYYTYNMQNIYDSISISKTNIKQAERKIQTIRDIIDIFSGSDYNNINLNESQWDSIENIENNSQDFIMIRYLLNNISDPKDQEWSKKERLEILKEADRILSTDWTILIINPCKSIISADNREKIVWWDIYISLKKWEYTKIKTPE